jgi:L-cystine uptake protein TcyP (sodium:dicarboxylate symporter family)
MSAQQPEQNIANHSQIVPVYHYGLFSIVVTIIVMSFTQFFQAIKNNGNVSLSIILVLIGIAMVMGLFIYRGFALKAQDRAIRAEENLRHFVLTGKLLNSQLKMPQIIALRFAPDNEFPQLAERALNEDLNNKAIKQAIQNWKADYYRV